MYQAKYSNVKDLLKWGQNDETVKRMIEVGLQPSGSVMASYWPSGANWAWQIGIYTVNGELYELLTRFGSVEGGRRLYTGSDHVAVEAKQ